MARPKTLPSPEVRQARARKGALARNSLDSYVKQIVARAPELTEEHYAKLRTIGLRLDGGAVE
ncbi:hypothetical protein OHA02_18070 [Streptomyces phaeochromogenes]|nr:hypothetical protein [Streptomyces phaeochromogenes]